VVPGQCRASANRSANPKGLQTDVIGGADAWVVMLGHLARLFASSQGPGIFDPGGPGRQAPALGEKFFTQVYSRLVAVGRGYSSFWVLAGGAILSNRELGGGGSVSKLEQIRVRNDSSAECGMRNYRRARGTLQGVRGGVRR
jgi:hypothetical protein